MAEFLMFMVGSSLGLAFMLSTLFIARDLSARYGVKGIAQIGSTLLLSLWWLGLTGYVLLALKAFTLPWTGALALAQSVWAIARVPRPKKVEGSQLWSACKGHLRALDGFTRALVFGVFIAWIMRALRLIASPPLLWDSMTYHLPKAADYVREGTFSARVMPDAWTYYAYFRDLGDLCSAWGMVWTHSDIWVNTVHLCAGVALGFGALELLRSFDVEPARAVRGAVLIALCPCIWNLSGTTYVDALIWSVLIWSVVFLGRLWREPSPFVLVLSSLGLGMCAAIKFSGIIPLAFGGLTMLVLVVRARASFKPTHIALALGGMSVGAIPYLRTWIEAGNPFYPFRLAFGPLVLSEGNMLLWKTFERFPPEMHPTWGRWSALAQVVLDLTSYPSNFGAGFLFFLPLALVGVRHVRRAHLSMLVPLGLTGILIFYQVAVSPSNQSQQAVWMWIMGRLVFPFYILVIVLAALPEHRMARFLWKAGLGCTAASWFMCEYQSWSALDLKAALMQGVVALATLAMLAGVPRVKARHLAFVLAAVSVLVWFVGTREVTRAMRWDLFAHSTMLMRWRGGDDQARTMEAAERLDQPGGVRIAVAAGPNPIGHNWVIYPFMGSMLQNDVCYIPPTRDGSIPSHLESGPLREVVSERDWLERLEQAHIEYFVPLVSPGPEAEILERLGTPTIPLSSPGHTRIYRLAGDASQRAEP